MKKVLFATTALVLTAGMAAAEVKLSGTARAGLVYQEDRSGRDTQVSYRLRFNIDALKELDSGVTLGGRIRLQYDAGDDNLSDANGTGTYYYNGYYYEGDLTLNGEGGAELSAAYIYAETSGFRVEVGNANGAFDSVANLYASELGFVGTTQGSYNLAGLSFADFSSGPYDGGDDNTIGIFAAYEVGGLVARASYHTPDQTDDDAEDEYSISVDYTTGPITLSGAYVFRDGSDASDGWAVIGQYALNDTTNLGLQVLGTTGGAGDDNIGVTAYGSVLVSGVKLGAFVSYTDADGSFTGEFDGDGDPVFVSLDNDVSYGIGAEYDLGGATLSGTIQNGYDEEIYADVGINFSF